MARRSTATLWLICLLCIGGLSPAAHADTDWGPDLGPETEDFALRLEHSDIELRYNGAIFDSTVERLGITVTQRVSPGLDGILSAGYEDISQVNNPDLAGQAPAGYYGGIALRGLLLEGPRLDAAISAHYSYHRLEASPIGQNIVVSWHQAWAQVVAGVRPRRQLRLYAGARYGVVDGEQRLSGTVNRSTAFQQTRRSGYFVGLDLNVDRTGHIGFQVNDGQFRGVAIFFARRF